MKREIKKFTAFIRRQSWIFAKTFAKTSPHEYIVKERLSAGDRKIFEQFVMFIRENGVRKKYKKTYCTHFDLDGYSYWTMGAPLDITIIINRHDLGFYDRLAEDYDRIFSDEESRIENAQIGKMIQPAASGNILDIGCGTGLLLDILEPNAGFNYHGIDPSKKMLDQLSLKHKSWRLTCATFEDFELPKTVRYDLIVSLFGAMNYINPAAFGKIGKLPAAGGKFFLMFYKKHYFPVLYQRSGICFSHYATDPAAVEKTFGATFEYGNYLIATNIELNPGAQAK